ncbi:hypothetical protein [Streptomyces sp. NBC_01465]|uniref:hypothetical protein n=1 Tax=Streptomyces sp. NBC_01465 TaxID=2903878 RepID=UPI002E374A02|nr:hypothetical protein [Streptomyces sp. NBC_01465]
MRLTRILAATVAAVTLSSFAPAVAAPAHPNPPVEPTQAGCDMEKDPGCFNLYAAPGGWAKIDFDPDVQQALDDAGVSFKFIAPWKGVPGGAANSGVYMPVGSRLDGMRWDTRITYPGGWIASSKDKKHTFSFNGASLRIEPLVTGFYVAPWLDGKQPYGKDAKMLNMSIIQALTEGTLFGPHFDDGKFAWGPTGIRLFSTVEFAKGFQMLGVPVKAGQEIGKITVRWGSEQLWDKTRDHLMGATGQ